MNYSVLKKNSFIIILFVYLASSLNSPIFFPTDFGLITLFNFVRSIAPIIVFLITVYLFILKKFNIKKNSLFFLIFIISQIIGFFFYEEKKLTDLYWIVSAFSLVFFLECYCNELKISKFIIITFLSMLSIIGAAISSFIIYEEIQNIQNIYMYAKSIYSSEILAETQDFLGHAVPRSSGYNRMLLIIFLFIFPLIFFNKYFKIIDKNILIKAILYSVCIFIGLIFWKTQNRAVLYFYLILFIIYSFSFVLFAEKKKNLIKIFLIFILPFMLFKSELSIKVFLFEKQITTKILSKTLEKNDKTSTNNNEKKRNLREKIEKEIEIIDEQISVIKNNNSRWTKVNETSGRIKIWNDSISLAKKNIFFGQGPQSDRNLLKKNASNIFIYTLLCRGLLGIILLLNYLLRLLVHYIIFIKKHGLLIIINNHILCFASLNVFFLTFRGLVENSFSIFGIDMILFLISVKYIENFINLKNNY